MSLNMHKNRKLELSENSTIQRRNVKFVEWKIKDVTALKEDVTILPDLLYTDYLLFLEQPELTKNFKNSLIWAILLQS